MSSAATRHDRSINVSAPDRLRARTSSTALSARVVRCSTIETASACLDREWKYSAPLRDGGIGQDVVEADQAVRRGGELSRRRLQDLETGQLRSPVELLGHLGAFLTLNGRRLV